MSATVEKHDTAVLLRLANFALLSLKAAILRNGGDAVTFVTERSPAKTQKQSHIGVTEDEIRRFVTRQSDLPEVTDAKMASLAHHILSDRKGRDKLQIAQFQPPSYAQAVIGTDPTTGLSICLWTDDMPQNIAARIDILWRWIGDPK